jgi:hypothetical protein
MSSTALPADDYRTVLSPREVELAAGGYKRAADQLRELHDRGFYRAYRSKVTGEVVLERPHYDAVSAGLPQAGQPTHTPQLRAPKLRRVK